MISRILIFIIFFLNFASSAIFANNKIVVKVNNKIITDYDIKNKILTTLVINNKEINQKNIDDLKKNSLDILIQNRLKLIEIEKYNFKKDNQRINNYLRSISSDNIDNLKSKFEVNNIDFEIFVDEIDLEFKWRNLIYENFSKKININPDDLEAELKEMMAKQKEFASFNLSEIVIDSSNLNPEKIKLIQNEIKNKSFEDAVIKFSISTTSETKGKLGWINYSSLSNNILEVLNEMKIGDTSKPIIRQNTIVFLKLNDKKISSSNNLDFNKLKKELLNQKKNEIFQLYSNSYLSKLKNNSFIEYLK